MTQGGKGFGSKPAPGWSQPVGQGEGSSEHPLMRSLPPHWSFNPLNNDARQAVSPIYRPGNRASEGPEPGSAHPALSVEEPKSKPGVWHLEITALCVSGAGMK